MNAIGATSAVSGALAGTRLLVLGAAGEIGEGIVREALRHDAEVLAVSRSRERLDVLMAQLQKHDGARGEQTAWSQRLTTIVGGFDSEQASAKLADFLTPSSRQPTAIVASLGGWRQGPPVTETRLGSWTEALDQSLTAHMLAARSLLPLIAATDGASYTLVNGGGALRAVPGAGAMCVSAAGQLMLMRVLDAEHRADAVRINTLLLDTPVRTRSRPSGPDGWISASDAGAASAFLASRASTHRGHVLVLDHPDARRQFPAPFS